MKEKPILFSGPMVSAILEKRKTQTRRVVKPQPPMGARVYGPEMYEPVDYDRYGNMVPGKPVYGAYADNWGVECPYGKPGDQLWVRESWWERKDHIPELKDPGAIRFTEPSEDLAYLYKKRPSIHMPRWASRIQLEIIDVRIERLQVIAKYEASAEGICYNKEYSYKAGFKALWNSINAKRGFPWDMNPWVWVIEFRRV